jgi:hypothetical protein
MFVPKKAHIMRSFFLDGSVPFFAMEVVDATMAPMYEPGDELYTDPALELKIGRGHVFFSPGRRKAVMRLLVAITADSWIVKHLVPPTESKLKKRTWPHCERVDAVKYSGRAVELPPGSAVRGES